MGLYDDPVRWGRTDTEREDERMHVRQCALCEHGCLEFEWLCMCCGTIRKGGSCSGAIESRLNRPLLPPHWPKHARIVLTITVGPSQGSSTSTP